MRYSDLRMTPEDGVALIIEGHLNNRLEKEQNINLPYHSCICRKHQALKLVLKNKDSASHVEVAGVFGSPTSYFTYICSNHRYNDRNHIQVRKRQA